MSECPYLSGKKTEECPWIEPACTLGTLKKGQVLPLQTLAIIFDTFESTSKVTQKVWKENAHER
jgi:hypothetical protein